MAIQIPNPGTGNGATGDNEFVLWSKVKDNFNDSNNAASRLVGNNVRQVPLCSVQGVGLTGWGGEVIASPKLLSNYEKVSSVFRVGTNDPDAPTTDFGTNSRYWFNATSFSDMFITLGSSEVYTRRVRDTDTVPVIGAWVKSWSDKNTKLDTNGAIAPSSPTIDLYSDHIKTNEDGASMNPEFVRNGVGDYTIKNTTGLRDEGWYIKIPNDMNGNPKVAIAIDTDKDGNLSIKTYRRIFSMETFTFIPDLETPLDIPEGRWIDLRFNDLPDEPMPQEV